MLQSLSGHQSPIECVSFDQAEEVVVAGAHGGTIKLWDLDQAKGVSAVLCAMQLQPKRSGLLEMQVRCCNMQSTAAKVLLSVTTACKPVCYYCEQMSACKS